MKRTIKIDVTALDTSMLINTDYVSRAVLGNKDENGQRAIKIVFGDSGQYDNLKLNDDDAKKVFASLMEAMP